ncbi:MAG: EamA family transporter [bacterium]
MTLLAFLLIIASAALHSIWNFMLKRSKDKQVSFWLATAVSIVVFLPIALVLLPHYPVPHAAWIFIVGSGLTHCGYMFLLGRAYEVGDLSLVYPIARSAPVLVPVWAALFLGERYSPWGLIGIATVILGVYMLSLRDSSWYRGLGEFLRALRERPYQFALLTTLAVSTYSIIDKMGVQHAHPFLYLYLVDVVRVPAYVPYLYATRRERIAEEWSNNKWNIVGVGILVTLSYVLILWVMRWTRLGYIVSIRQVSIVFGVIMGTFLLKEPYGGMRILASAVIFAGVFIIKVLG